MSKADLKRYAVLYVDDEEQALKYFPKLFGGEMRCLTANSVAQAHEVIARAGDTIGVVISDQRMPVENGVTLLSWLREHRPHVVRILTTAYSDLDSAISAVNSGAIFRYVVKPWEHREMYGVLARAMEYHLVTRERDALLKEKLTTLQRLVVLDRRRGCAVLAAVLSQRLRNPLPALRSYLAQVAELDGQRPDCGAPVSATDLWDLAQRESRGLIRMATSVSQRVLVGDGRLTGGLAAADLLASASSVARQALGRAAELSIDPALATCTADKELALELMAILVRLALRAEGQASHLRLSAAPTTLASGRPGMLIGVLAGPTPWTAAQLARLDRAPDAAGHAVHDDADLLTAFLIAHHHAGSLCAHTAPPSGPGFSLVLPLDPLGEEPQAVPQDWIDDIMTFQQEP
jgi:FixJ family two-component response regulator